MSHSRAQAGRGRSVPRSMKTSFRSLGFVTVCLLLACVTGCAHPKAVYGERARFSPAYRGYVMATNDGSDDPGKDDTVLLLRDPLTGNKLRCRDEVLTWRELHEDVAQENLRDSRAGIGAGVTAGVVFGPVAALQPLGALTVYAALSSAGGLYNLLRTKDAPELLAAAIALYERERYAQSSLVMEHALARDGQLGVASKALYYLGLAYAEQGKKARATVALTTFVDRAAIRDVDAYRKAETTLRSFGVARRPCASDAPVDLHW